LAQEICDRLASPESLASICRDPHMPEAKTVYNWKEQEPRFAAMIDAANRVRAELLLDECLEIADNSGHDIGPMANQTGQCRSGTS
jgi:hypothetical protein